MRLAIIIGVGLLAVAIGVSTALRAPTLQNVVFERAATSAMATMGEAASFGDDDLKIVFCGTGSPLPSAKRAQTCTAIIAGDRFYLVDVGTGSWETVQLAGLPGDRLGGIFLTHFHSDHIGDLTEANLGAWVAGRPATTPVFGPPGVASVVDGVNLAIAHDNAYRTAHHGKAIAAPRTAGLTAEAFPSPQTPTVVFEHDGLKVTAFQVDHEPVEPAVGYRFDYRGRSVVISGDTSKTAALIAVAKGADVLVHEAQANHMVATLQKAAAAAGNARVAKILSDIPSYHTSPVEAAEIANEADVRALFLNHLTPAPDNFLTRRLFMRDVSKTRSGVVLAEDGMVVTVAEDGVSVTR